MDAESGAKSRDYFIKLKNAGHHVVILGSISDAVDLTTIPTIGYDRRLNLYLFDKAEMDEITAEFGSMHFFFLNYYVKFFELLNKNVFNSFKKVCNK